MNCPRCGAVEVAAMTPRTVYECGSSFYDQPGTFRQSDICRVMVEQKRFTSVRDDESRNPSAEDSDY